MLGEIELLSITFSHKEDMANMRKCCYYRILFLLLIFIINNETICGDNGFIGVDGGLGGGGGGGRIDNVSIETLEKGMTKDEKIMTVKSIFEGLKEVVDQSGDSDLKEAFKTLDNFNTYAEVVYESITNGDSISVTAQKVIEKYVDKEIIGKVKEKAIKTVLEKAGLGIAGEVYAGVKIYQITYNAGKWGVYGVVSALPDGVKDKMANSEIGQKLEGVSNWTSGVLDDAAAGAKEIGGYIASGFRFLFKRKSKDEDKKKENSTPNKEKAPDSNNGKNGDMTSYPKDDMPSNGSQSGDQVCYPDDDKPWGDSQPGDLVSLPIDDGKPEISLPGDLVSLPDDDDGQGDGDSIVGSLLDNVGVPLPTVHYTRLLYIFSGEKMSDTLSDQLNSLVTGKFLKSLSQEVERLKKDWANFTKF